MVLTTQMLVEQYSHYANPKAKIRRLVETGKLTVVTHGIYETNKNTPSHYLAGVIYGPSYISFDFALSYYGLIPEAVYSVTSATFKKKKTKEYETPFGRFNYRDIPEKAFPFGITIMKENGYTFRIASPEKAICDKLYTMPPVTSQRDIIQMLFEDLRIDEDDFNRMDFENMAGLCNKYACNNLKYLAKYISKGVYGRPHKTVYGDLQPSEPSIIEQYTKDARGVVVGYRMYNAFGITTQISKRTLVFSSFLTEQQKTIGSVQIQKRVLVYDEKIKAIICLMEILSHIQTIEDINYSAFRSALKQLTREYDDETFDLVQKEFRYPKWTIAFLLDILERYQIPNELTKYLSPLSKYTFPKLTELV